MNHLQTILIALPLLLTPGVAVAQHDHESDLRAGKIPRWTALVSDEVAIQRLRASGIEPTGELRENSNGNFLIGGRYRGREIMVEMDRRSGVIRDARQGGLIVAPSLVRPGIERSYALREQIARGQVIVVPLPPPSPRSRVVLPAGERPIAEERDEQRR